LGLGDVPGQRPFYEWNPVLASAEVASVWRLLGLSRPPFDEQELVLVVLDLLMIEGKSRFYFLFGVPVRLWEGKGASGIKRCSDPSLLVEFFIISF
jgi:hypothetical protein